MDEGIDEPVLSPVYVMGQVLAPMQYDGTMDGALFAFWFRTMLLPALTPGSMIVMDNARFHQKKVLAEYAGRAACRVLFLPPYSPDLNPIEKFWAWLNATLRNILPVFPSLNLAIHFRFELE